MNKTFSYEENEQQRDNSFNTQPWNLRTLMGIHDTKH